MLHKNDLNFQQTEIWGWFIEEKLVLSQSTRCDQIHANKCYVLVTLCNAA